MQITDKISGTIYDYAATCDSIGKRGYFGNTLPDLEAAIERQDAQTLGLVAGASAMQRYARHDTYSGWRYFALFVPADTVVIKEQSFRPFATVQELLDKLHLKLGDAVVLQRKNAEKQIAMLITGIDLEENYIHLGAFPYQPDALFRDFWIILDDEKRTIGKD